AMPASTCARSGLGGRTPPRRWSTWSWARRTAPPTGSACPTSPPCGSPQRSRKRRETRMPQPVDVRTPVSTGNAKQVGKRLWRKQVLPVGEFKVGARELKVTPDYVRQVADAFTEGAYDTVPTMLADKNNDHTMAVLDEGGQVLALEAEDDGLYATVQLSEPAAERVERNPKLGVSVRIRENYERADGRFYPAAMQHLLLTWDPKIPGMKPWAPLDLSNSAGEALVIDLSAATYDSTPTPGEGEPIMADLTPDELAQV